MCTWVCVRMCLYACVCMRMCARTHVCVRMCVCVGVLYMRIHNVPTHIQAIWGH